MRSNKTAGQVKKGLLWSFALLSAAIATVFAVVPKTLSALYLAFWLIVGSLIVNHNPPSIASGIVAANNKIDSAEVNRKRQALQTILQLTFPIGTKAERMVRELRRQGFKPLAPPPRNCIPNGQPVPVGITYTECYDARNTLQYSWSSALVCGETITVRWTVNDRSEITTLRSGWSGSCL